MEKTKGVLVYSKGAWRRFLSLKVCPSLLELRGEVKREQAMPQDSELTYKGGFSKLVPGGSGKQAAAYDGMQEVLEELAAKGFEHLETAVTQAPAHVVDAPKVAAEKLDQLSAEMAGLPQIVTLHALVIAASRRQNPPAIAQRLFLEMWRSHAGVLLQYLDLRWSLSAVLTFQVFGENEAQRLAAAQINTLFSMMKLYESERLYSGVAPDQPFRIRRRIRAALPFGLSPYALQGGDLDRNLLGRLWLDAEADPVLRPLACRLLSDINRDKGGIFRRLTAMKRLRREMRQRRESRSEDG